MPKVTTPATVGNQFGYLCPQCKKGDNLSISFVGTCTLMPEGTDDAGDHEWDSKSCASCSCGWSGLVQDFAKAKNFNEEG